jgi:hypothetical protein
VLTSSTCVVSALVTERSAAIDSPAPKATPTTMSAINVRTANVRDMLRLLLAD